jgi:hypothetical protein
MKPLAACPRSVLANIRGVFTDIDETVSTAGHLTAEAYGALAALKKAGLLVVPVTGRPAGWCDHIARFWPVDAVVGENGAFWMWHDGKVGRLRTRFIQSDAERADGRRRLDAVRADVLHEVKARRLPPTSPIAWSTWRSISARTCRRYRGPRSSASWRSSSGTALRPRSARSTSTVGSATTTSSPPPAP